MANNKSKEISSGTKYGRITILGLHHKDSKWRRFYRCKCDCGAEKIIHGSALVSGNTKSCGCLSDEKKRIRISENQSEITAIILGYKRHAKQRGFEWELSRDQVEKIVKRNCHYCGVPPSNRKITKNSLNGGLLYSGIDRLDSTKDYAIKNVVPCCRVCNYAKSNMSIGDFHKWAIRIGEKAMADQWG